MRERERECVRAHVCVRACLRVCVCVRVRERGRVYKRSLTDWYVNESRPDAPVQGLTE